MDEEITVVGMACRYPDALSPAQLWENVLARRRAFRPLPPGRLPAADYHSADRADPDRTYVTHAAVLEGWEFDRGRFRVPGHVWRAVDTAHWLALEVAADALADAGLPDGRGVDPTRVGVILGNSLTGEFSRAAALRVRWPYARRAFAAALGAHGMAPDEVARVLTDAEAHYKAPFAPPSDESLAGALANTIAGRVCNHFDFHGTGYTVDAACASSLVAVAAAADAIAAGALDLALAGGVDLSLDPFELVGFARLGALADGPMRIYDAEPTGFLPGEGCGIVALCRASYAAEHGLRPYARLLGWATSADGRGGLTHPELAGQRLALERAYVQARLDPGDVRLIEGHGTGTRVGDETELRALIEVRGAHPAGPAALGSVKGNIGHTKAAAGVAGLIKAALAVHHQVLPPITGCVRPHPLLAGAGRSLHAPDQPRAWPDGAPRFAGVSAMGFGGINAHAVLAGAGATERRHIGRRERHLGAPHPDHEVVVAGAGDGARLRAELVTLAAAARELSLAELGDVAAYQAARHTGRPAARFAAAVADPAELCAAVESALAALDRGERRLLDPDRRAFLVVGEPLRVGYLFSGQAAPAYPGLGALARLLPDGQLGYADPLPVPPSGVTPTETAQPAIVRASLAGLAWLDRLGVTATAALGHSLGELTALAWAGAIAPAVAYRLARTRGAAMAATGGPPGAMAGLTADLTTATDLVRDRDVVVAADNGAGQVVLSGRRDEVWRVVDEAAARGIAATLLPVSHAFHSPWMAPAVPAVRAHLEASTWQPPTRPVACTVTGDWLAPDADLPELLTRQLTAPVHFRAALAALGDAVDLMVEVGPGGILAGLARAAGHPAVALDTGAPSAAGVAAATAALYAAGAADGVEPYLADRFTRPLDPARPRRFLANPCEVGGDGAAPAVPRRAPAARPHPPAASDLAATRGAGGDLTSRVVARLAAAAELPPESIGPDTRLVADLHLSSLRVVQLTNELATALGKTMTAAAPDLFGATVADLGAALAALPDQGPTRPAATVPGVRPWVRVFADELVPTPSVVGPPSGRRGGWLVVGRAYGHPLRDAVVRHFPGCGPPAARLLALAPGLTALPVDQIVTALRDSVADGLPLVVVHHRGVGAAVGRSLTVERPESPVLVLDVPATEAGIELAAVEAGRRWSGFDEVVYGADGVRTTRVTAALALPPRRDDAIPLLPGEVCLVTGGAKGIGAEAAAAVAAATGATVVLFGRAAGEDPRVADGVDMIAARGGKAFYVTADLTDRDATAAAVAEAVQRFGPVRGLIHAAGNNTPGRIATITAAALRATLGPKAAGLDHLLAALDLDRLRFGVTFGSVIARTGLPGAAAYSIANEWLARRGAELTAVRPGVRWLDIGWSAWSETGMGVRLGALDQLVRLGLAPIPPAAGTDVLLRLLAEPDTPAHVVVAGRLPRTPTLRWRREIPPSARFLERSRSHTPGVELVSDAAMSIGDDPYLADHRIDGVPVLPAVLGLEAIAQAADALGGLGVSASTGAGDGIGVVFRDVVLSRPVTVPVDGSRSVRVSALTEADHRTVAAVLRSAETDFAVEHVRASVGGPPPAGPVAEPASGPLMDTAAWYGPLFFHGPRFQRVRGCHVVGAYRCVARVEGSPDARWFGGFHDPRLVLGDPGARDAYLHVLQACVPDRRVLPVAVAEIVVRRPASGPVTVLGRQRSERDDEYVFDLVVTDGAAEPCEWWRGLRLRATAPIDHRTWPIALLAPYLTRRLRDDVPGLDLTVVAAGADPTGTSTRPAAAGTRPGGPWAACGAAVDGHRLVAVARRPVTVDWTLVGDAPDDVLGPEVRGRVGGDLAAARARVAACRAALRRFGSAGTALAVEGDDPSTGLLWLRDGDVRLATGVFDIAPDRSVAICVGVG